MQEVLLAKCVVFVCGAKALPWSCFSVGIDRIIGAEGPWNMPCCRLIQVQQSYALRKRQMLDTMHDLRDWGCQDPRDHIGALSSICTGPYKIDYARSVEENYLGFAKALVDEGRGVSVLVSAALRLPRAMTALQVDGGLPSWVPDWREPVVGVPPAAASATSDKAGFFHELLPDGSHALHAKVRSFGSITSIDWEGGSIHSYSHSFKTSHGASGFVSVGPESSGRQPKVGDAVVDFGSDDSLVLVLEELSRPLGGMFQFIPIRLVCRASLFRHAVGERVLRFRPEVLTVDIV